MTRVNPSEPRRSWSRSPGWLIALAAVVLASGACVYVFGRPPGTASMLPAGWTFLDTGTAGWAGGLIGSWPTFAHAFAFSLMTCLVLPQRLAWVTAACVGWFLVECTFEIGQHRKISPWLSGTLEGRFTGIPVLDHLPAYFSRGHFDPADIAAAGGGCLLAWALVRWTRLGHPPQAALPMSKGR